MKKYKKIEHYSSEAIDDVLNEKELELAKTRNKMRLAANIEDYMEHLKWNKSDLAAKMGKHPSEISKWFSGTHNFTIETLTEIAFTFGIELSQLFSIPKSNVVTFTISETDKKPVSPINYYTPFRSIREEASAKRRSESGNPAKEYSDITIHLVSE